MKLIRLAGCYSEYKENNTNFRVSRMACVLETIRLELAMIVSMPSLHV
jgi:hypothetical protein